MRARTFVRCRLWALGCLWPACEPAAAQIPPPSPGFAFEQRDDRLVLTRAGGLVAHYVFRDTQILRPYFAQVRTPDGIQVTRNHPPVAGQDPVDHATMHPGIWLAFGDICGNDFWRNRAAIRHDRFVAPPGIREDRIRFATGNALLSTNGTRLGGMICRFTISLDREGYLLVWESELRPAIDGFYFGDQEEMGFGVRVATAISERNGGVIRSATGETSAKVTWGKAFDWCDYSGVLDGRRAGIAVMAPPENFRASWFHNRDYGLMVANPFGRRALGRGDPSRVEAREGDTLKLRWAAFIHSSPANGAPDIAGAYRAFASNR